MPHYLAFGPGDNGIMPEVLRRPDPDQLLRQLEAEDDYNKTGRLKVFLGYASGVGKSFRMLDEGRRRRERSQDVVVGAVQPKGSPDLDAILGKLEVIRLRSLNGGTVMDVPAIVARHPGVCLVDGLAYDNPPGARHPHRWQDVKELLEAGISVIGSVNIQYIEELRERVEHITGKHVSETVPQSFISAADEIVVVDAPPELCITRADPAASAQKLSELREIALLLAADVVDRQLESYLGRNGVQQIFGTQERILVCITPRANAAEMITSGKRNAERFHGDLIVAYVRQDSLSAADQAALDRNLDLASAAGAEVEILEGEDPVDAILSFARERGVTQIFVGHSLREKWWQRIAGSPLDHLIRAADGMDVRVFPH